MTIADLAVCFRGVPRDALILIDTPEGLKRLRLVSATHARVSNGGVLGFSQDSKASRYAVVLHPEGRVPPGR